MPAKNKRGAPRKAPTTTLSIRVLKITKQILRKKYKRGELNTELNKHCQNLIK